MRETFGVGVELKSKFGTKFGKLFIGDYLIGSVTTRSSVNSSHVLAHWPGGPLWETPDWNVGKVQFFLEATFTFTECSIKTDLTQIFAFVHWLRPQQLKGTLPQNVCYICETIGYWVTFMQMEFLPVHRISYCRAHITLLFQFSKDVTETVLIASSTPLQLKL